MVWHLLPFPHRKRLLKGHVQLSIKSSQSRLGRQFQIIFEIIQIEMSIVNQLYSIWLWKLILRNNLWGVWDCFESYSQSFFTQLVLPWHSQYFLIFRELTQEVGFFPQCIQGWLGFASPSLLFLMDSENISLNKTLLVLHLIDLQLHTQSSAYLSTPVQSFVFIHPLLSMYRFWLLKCAADFSDLLCTYEWMPTPTSGGGEVTNEKLADNILSSCLFSTNHAEILPSQ